ncbi:hypothetical protein [Rhodopirellula sp. P2]|uniref:hypothetical protein n=1 Tax=Rhodopirellula sp. P2 TaxID=2127060 RepID=UPI002367BE1E|nr:hypothetical protein [Rhodopirellula sp. P2]WDQ17657.1 hypothetical protein PSR62_03675 [Rhodopirellula sp. P2]
MPSQDTAKPLFPLPLTPLETFFVLDEQQSCPIVNFIELQFSTPLQLPILQTALKETALDHPLLSCKLVREGERLFWHFDPDLTPRVLTNDDLPLTTGPAGNPKPQPFDLFQESGCRFWYVPEGAGSRLYVQVHHACSDGVGIRQVILGTFTRYARATGDPDCGKTSRKSSRSAPNPERLRDRYDFTELLSKPPKRQLTTWDRIRNAYYFHFQRPAVLSKPPTAVKEQGGVSNEASLGEPLRHILFSREESATIEKACSDASIRVNDLAIAMLFQTFEQWEQTHGDGKAIRYRVMMPVDLRSRKDLDLPASNRLSFAFLGRRKDQCGDVDALVQEVAEEVLAIKDSRVHMDFLDGLSAAVQHPRLMRWVIGHSRQMTTSVLTYTGDLSRGMRKFFPEVDGQLQIGDATLRNALGSPPAREGTNVSLGICINWGQICVSASWNREAWDAATTDQFLEAYTNNWRHWLQRREGV